MQYLSFLLVSWRFSFVLSVTGFGFASESYRQKLCSKSNYSIRTQTEGNIETQFVLENEQRRTSFAVVVSVVIITNSKLVVSL